MTQPLKKKARFTRRIDEYVAEIISNFEKEAVECDLKSQQGYSILTLCLLESQKVLTDECSESTSRFSGWICKQKNKISNISKLEQIRKYLQNLKWTSGLAHLSKTITKTLKKLRRKLKK